MCVSCEMYGNSSLFVLVFYFFSHWQSAKMSKSLEMNCDIDKNLYNKSMYTYHSLRTIAASFLTSLL